VKTLIIDKAEDALARSSKFKAQDSKEVPSFKLQLRGDNGSWNWSLKLGTSFELYPLSFELPFLSQEFNPTLDSLYA